MISRRNALMSTLFGAGCVGLRAIATGLPAAFLLNPRKALADTPAPTVNPKAQFIILSTSGNGDPMNASTPGTYSDPGIYHSPDPTMVATNITLNGHTTQAAMPWSTLPQNVLDRSAFWHIMTNTPVHPKEPDVLKLMDMTQGEEMLPSLLAQQLAPSLGTIQTEPISLGAASPSEGLTFGGQALPIIPALALKDTLTNPTTGGLAGITNLQALRDQTLNQLYDLYKTTANPAQKTYIDSLVTSQSQVRNIKQDLLAQLGSITDNTATSQVIAAVTLIQMKVSPVIAIHIPFGGDNHRDIALATETAETITGVATIVQLMAALASAGLQDQVTFATLNVFGRTLNSTNTDGRQHNQNHQVCLTIGSAFKGGIIGGVGPLAGDYGCLDIDPTSGLGQTGSSVKAVDTLGAYGKTLLAAVGTDQTTVDTLVQPGSVITAALA